MSFDSETARLIDRIQATAFYQAKLALIKDKSPQPDRKSGRNRERSSRTLDAFGARSWTLFERNVEKKFGFGLG